MTLDDLLNSITIQGTFVEIKVFEDGEEKETEWFDYVDDLQSEDIDKYRDMKVNYIYSYGFTRYYPNSTKECACLVIEVEKE